ncbi:MAG: DUF305 domain-containing protein [Thermoguttaceae bacterium]
MQQVTHCKCSPDCKCRDAAGKCNCKEGCRCGTDHTSHSSDMAGMDMSGMDMQTSDPNKNIFLQMMDDMMVEMDKVPLKNRVEYDFLAQMIPHHQGAVKMAEYEIQKGTNKEMVQLAKSILAEQKMEIEEMTFLLKDYETSGSPATPLYKAAMNKTMQTMMEQTPSANTVFPDVDYAFAAVMIPHHQAAVDMSLALLEFHPDEQLANRAKKIIADQQVEIKQMQDYLGKEKK